MFEALIYLLDNIYIRFGPKLYRQIVGIPMSTNCAPLVADLFLFCYERDFMTSLSDVKQAEIIEAFKSTSRYLDDLLNIESPYFECMVNRIYPPELQWNKANTSDTEAPVLDLHLSISKGFVSSKIYDKRDNFEFDVVNFPFLDGDVSRSTSYGVYISPLIRFARVSSHVADFNPRNKSLTAKLLQQGYRYHILRKTFSTFYRRHYELVSDKNQKRDPLRAMITFIRKKVGHTTLFRLIKPHQWPWNHPATKARGNILQFLQNSNRQSIQRLI